MVNIVLAVFAILIGGGLLLTPNGIVVIVENPAFRIVVGLVGVALGAASLIGRRSRAAGG